MVAPNCDISIMMILGDHWLEYEAALALASFQATQNIGKITFAQPRANAFWPHPPVSQNSDWFIQNGAEVIQFEPRVFGPSYPIGNKIEALFALPEGKPFIFFDTDTVFLRPIDWTRIDFSAPMASLKRTDTWPNLSKSDAPRGVIWNAVYTALGHDLVQYENAGHPEHAFLRYPYFNAGVITGPCPHQLAERWLDAAVTLRDATDPLIAQQPLDPWLDQVALAPTIAALGGGVDTAGMCYLDNEATCHYRRLSLAYAREREEVITVIENASITAQQIITQHSAARKIIFDGIGRAIRTEFHDRAQSWDEATLRKALKSNGYWMR